MRQLTADGRRIIDEVAQRHGVSGDAVLSLLDSLIAGGGSMAQFSHPELGGMGQWSRGGMTMVGDMFNNALKARVDALCAELSDLLGRQTFTFAPDSGHRRARVAAMGRSRARAVMGSGRLAAATARPACSFPAAAARAAPGGRAISGRRPRPAPRTTSATHTFPERGGWPST